MSSLLRPECASLFPLTKISDLEALFTLECIEMPEPNLALMSIIFGAVENSLVHLDYSVEQQQIAPSSSSEVIVNNSHSGDSFVETSKTLVTKRKISKATRGKRGFQKGKVSVGFKDATVQKGNNVKDKNSLNNGIEHPSDIESNVKLEESEVNESRDFPPLELNEVEALYSRFKQILISLIDLNDYNITENEIKTSGTPKELVKRVSDVIWSYLSRSYKADTPHIQSLYTYILGKKLDSFGVAIAVVAGCQILGLKDVHLALSEDHAWVVFGPEGQYTSEVTWHGKGVEDKRGMTVEDDDSWLYLKGNAVKCTRQMEATAIVASINFNISGSMNSSELMQIQQKLLWKLYNAEHLERYPMALACLAELEEIIPTPNQKSCATLFRQAVLSNQLYYNDMHIYPYTFYAGYFFRQQDYKSALKYWGDAARIVQKYSRSKNDEEIYREFFFIATDYLMTLMKSSSTGFSAHSIIRDPSSFAHLLRFFDGICMWEETSRSPIVHITWAKAWVSAIGKFDYTIRRMVQITLGTVNGEEKENSNKLSSGRAIMGLDDEHEKDSGIDEEDVVTPAVTLYSEKMQQLKDLLRNEKYNPSNMTLLLTAQSAATIKPASVIKPALDVGNGANVVGRTRRDRLSHNIETSHKDEKSFDDKAPPRKRSKRESPGAVIPHCK